MNIISTKLSETERLKELLYQSIKSPGLNPANTFMLLATLLEREFADDDRSKAFVEFIRAPHPKGLGMEPDQLQKIVGDLKHPHEIAPFDDQKIIARMRQMRERVNELIKAEIAPLFDYGKNQHTTGVDIINSSKTKGGTDPTYALRRLKRDRPDLAERVVKGELSANAAAIEAGFRKKPSPLDQMRRWCAKASSADRETFLRELSALCALSATDDHHGNP